MSLSCLRVFAAVVCLAPLALAPARAEDPVNLSSVKLGEVHYGPRVSLEELKGHVVLIDFWGTH